MKNIFLLRWELLRWQTQDGLCLRGLGILMTVIYKPIAQEASLNQQDNGTRENLRAAAVVECRLGDGARPLSGRAGWLWAEGTGCRSTLECGPVPTADSHPASPGRGGLSRRLDLESCLFGCLFVVWLKRVAQLAQLLSTKGSCI